LSSVNTQFRKGREGLEDFYNFREVCELIIALKKGLKIMINLSKEKRYPPSEQRKGLPFSGFSRAI